MGVRRQSREWALQFLFQRDFNEGDLAPALAEFWTDKDPSDKARSFTEEIVYAVENHRDQLDEVIGKYAQNWDVKRMGGVERNAMRMAVYEMTMRTDIPPVVSIDEAVEIAKAYSSNESGRFVNGVLDRVRADLGRPARAASPVSPQEL